MEITLMAVAGLAGAGLGWAFPSFQHRLYTEPEYRASPTGGRKLLLLRIFCAVAAAGALALAFRPGLYDFGPALLTAAFLLVYVALSSTDYDRRRIPNKLSYPAFVAALMVCWAWPDRSIPDILIGAGAGLGAGVLLVGLGIVLGGGGMGLGVGDGKLMVLMGATTGWPGLLPALLYGMLLGGVVAVFLLVRSGRKAAFSYGPYLAAGAALVMLIPGVR